MFNKYIGMPYDLRGLKGVNCWSLVAIVYDEIFNDKLVNYSSKNESSVSSAFTVAFAEGNHGFKRIESPENMCVAVMFSDSTVHCGIWNDNHLLHASKAAKQVVYQKMSAATRKFDRVEFWQR